MAVPETPGGVATLATPVAPAARHSHSDRPSGRPEMSRHHPRGTGPPWPGRVPPAALQQCSPPPYPPAHNRATYRAATAARCSRCAHACGRVPRHCRFQQPRAARREWGGKVAICAPPPVNARLGMSPAGSWRKCAAPAGGKPHRSVLRPAKVAQTLGTGSVQVPLPGGRLSSTACTAAAGPAHGTALSPLSRRQKHGGA